MTISVEYIRKMLGAEEPNYRQLAKLGPRIIPHLEVLVSRGNAHDGSKAASLLGMIPDARAVSALKKALAHASPVVRVAAAAALGNTRLATTAVHPLLIKALGDSDAGVRRLALKSSARRTHPALSAKIAQLARSDSSPGIRGLAAKLIGRR